MRTLISWIGWLDFVKDSYEISHTAPNIDIHKKANIKFEKHILLSTGAENNLDGKEERKAIKLYSHLTKEIKHCKFELVYLNIEDAFDYEEVYPKTEEILNQHKNKDVYVNFSIGTSTMRVIWAFLAESSQFNFKLIFGRDPSRIINGKNQFEQIVFKHLTPEVHSLESKPLQEAKNEIIITSTLQQARNKAMRAAQHNINTLIYGETGAGKEAIARYIHNNSLRNKREFIEVNCAAIGDELLESRLFGHKKGSFTGATSDQMGFFEKANNGTIFLDEIGDISSRMQQSLLRVIQEKKIVRIGETKTRDIDVKIVCATNKDLISEVQKGNFRADLYYRISEAEISLPSLNNYPLKEKMEIIDSIISKQAKLLSKNIKFDQKVRDMLYSYPYPGNFRELEAIIKNLYIFNDEKVDISELEIYLTNRTKLSDSDSIILNDIIHKHTLKIYTILNKHQKNTAKALGISVNTLKKYLNYKN
jgi:transcriptional regulator with PAS, ATPase and Fis domain